MLQQIRRGVMGLEPPVILPAAADAAVLMAFTNVEENPELVLTRRSAQLNAHAGEVAFPGGKRDATDTDLVMTALREADEEIALPPARVEVVGALPASVSKMGLQVVPIVGIIPGQIELIANEAEIDCIFRVPLRFFLERPTVHFTEREHQGVTYRIPCFHFEEQIIWGLTAHFITDFCNRIFAAGFDYFRPTPITR